MIIKSVILQFSVIPPNYFTNLCHSGPGSNVFIVYGGGNVFHTQLLRSSGQHLTRKLGLNAKQSFQMFVDLALIWLEVERRGKHK